MNEEIKENTQTLAPFTKLCMTIGNLPASYFESMSYYEQLIWFTKYLQEQVIPAVNQNAAAVTEVQGYFIELQKYVNDYFDNLDVQEEINNKLDEMALDGSLTNLIKGYVDPIYQEYENEVNNTLSNFQTQINSIASGSPIPVSSTDDMTDTTRVYLLTTTGHWYYYDGDSWEDGGVYQATELDDGSVYFSKLGTNVQNMYNTNGMSELISLSFTSGAYYNMNTSTIGTPVESANWNYTSVNVSEGDIYYIRGYSQASQKLWCTVDSNNKKLTITAIPNSTTGFERIIIPKNATKLLINGANVSMPTLTKITSVDLSSNIYDEIDDHIVTLTKNFDAIDIESLTSSFSSTGQPTRYCNWIHSSIDNDDAPDENDILKFECDIYSEDMSNLDAFYFLPKINASQYQVNVVTETSYLNNKLCINRINDNIYHITMKITSPSLHDNTLMFSPAETSSNADAHYTLFNIKLYNETQEENIELYSNIDPTSSQTKTKFSYALGTNDLNNYRGLGFKKWWAIGDSITEKNFRALYNYLDYCKEDLRNVEIVNKGIGGTGYKAGSSNIFVNRLSQLSSYDLENDIITVMGSINDIQYVPSNLGELGDTTNDTLYGAMYNFYNTLFTNLNGVRVGVISPINWKFYGNYNTTNLDKYNKALEDTCKLFNIPFLNISYITNLRPENSTFLNEYYMSDNPTASHPTPVLDEDGVHPNSEGHKMFYNRIKEFIQTL